MSKYANMRYTAIYRTSQDIQTEKSIPDQMLIVKNWAAKHGMIAAGGDLEQCGVSSTKRKKREDIDELIERKRKFDDFDAIIVHDYSRLTRRGTKDAFAIEKMLNDEGILVLSATEEIPDGPYADMIKTAIHTQHQSYVRDSSNRIVRGQMSSIMSGKSVGTTHTPYGIDRLYSSRDGTPRHYLRGLPDGSRIRINVKTGEVMSTYERHDHGEGNSEFYRKQTDEIVTFVPGDSKKLDVVRRVFRMALIDGSGYWTIARALNDDGIPSAKGGKWDKSSVRRLIICPVYTGRLVFNRVTEAEFFERSKDGPKAVPEVLIKKDAPRTRFRSPSEWLTVEVPTTKNILDDDLRAMVIPYQDMLHRKDAANRGKGLQRDKHSKSSFILKDVLRLKQDGSLMYGSMANQSRRSGRIYRYYKARRYSDVKHIGSVYGCLLPAEPLEGLVLEMLSKIFASAPDLKPQIVQFVKEQQAARHEERTRLGELEKQRTSLMKKISCFADVAEFDDLIIKKVDDMRARLRDLDLRIEVARERAPDGDPEAIADSVIAGLWQMRVSMDIASPMTLRKMLTVLVSKLECDPKSREVWLEMALPSWAVGHVGRIAVNKVCLGFGSLQSAEPYANNELLLAKVHMKCLPITPKSRISRELKDGHYTITDGLLTDKRSYTLEKLAPNGLADAMISDLLSASKTTPEVTSFQMGSPSNMTVWKHLAVPHDESNFHPLSTTYWTPQAIAA